MTTILSFIAVHMGFLWGDARFRITGSDVASSNGGDAFVMVESEALRLRFVRDRGQLLLDFQPVLAGDASEWFSVDLIRRLVLGTPESSGVLDEGYAAFLSGHISELEGRFNEEQWPRTRDELRRLKVLRSRELFG